MAKQNIAWKSERGRLFEDELAAFNDDLEYWKEPLKITPDDHSKNTKGLNQPAGAPDNNVVADVPPVHPQRIHDAPDAGQKQCIQPGDSD